MKRVLHTEERFHYAVLLYESGESLCAVAKALGTKPDRLRRSLELVGVRVRTVGEQLRIANERNPRSAARRLSPEELQALYWSEDRPSISDLAKRLGVHRDTLRDTLALREINRRSSTEQLRIDGALGRHNHGPGSGPSSDPPGVGKRWRAGKPFPKSPEVRAKIAATLTKRETRPCAWCGMPITRVPSKFRGRDGRAFCNAGCANLFRYRGRQR